MTHVHNRQGFTMIEIMVVIGIIAIVVGLLVPAVHQAIVHSKITHTRAEIVAITQALASFEETFGAKVPDRMRLDSRVIIEPYSGGDGDIDEDENDLKGDDTWFNGMRDCDPPTTTATPGMVIILPGPNGILESDTQGDSEEVPYIDAVIVEPCVGGDEDNGETLAGDDTWWDGTDGSEPGSPADIPPGMILIVPGPNGKLETVRASGAGHDNEVLHNAFYAYAGVFDATGNSQLVGDGSGAPCLAGADLNGVEWGNGNLDAAECLFYFLCVSWRANPTPATEFTAANFALKYVADPAGFQFLPAPWMERVNGGPLYDPGALRARDTDGDGYLELCDLFMNPLRYISRPPAMIVEPPAGNRGVNSAVRTGSDDRQFIAPGGSAPAGATIIHPGLDWVLTTAPNQAADGTAVPGGGDDIRTTTWVKNKVGLIYSFGPNGLDNLAVDEKVLGELGADDDGDGIVDNEDDINNL